MDVGGSNRRKHAGPRRPLNGAHGAARAKPAPPAPSINGGSDRFSYTIPSSYDRGLTVQKEIIASAEKHGFHGDNLFALNIALDEAVVNAIKHGNRLDPQKQVRVEAKVSAKRVEITIEDEGAGFARETVPDPTAEENLHRCSGRGILLIENYMSEVRWDRGGRRLHMVRENI